MKDLTDEQFHEAISSEDHLGMVVRAHIHIEYWVEKFVSASMPFYDNYKKQIDADYETKVLLGCAMGLSPDLKAPLQAVGKLRNKFAHEPNFKLSESAAKSIYQTLSSDHKEQLQRSYIKLSSTFGRKEKKYSALPLELKISLLFMFLRTKLEVANIQLQQGATCA
jgi:hypothetical protein